MRDWRIGSGPFAACSAVIVWLSVMLTAGRSADVAACGLPALLRWYSARRHDPVRLA